ncbi:MAG TPA: three-Cys-motif partner protein TcmP, partial [Anaerovoracaceae bacterium]|nr:three-Cys-motif partner protein TcmP [Anaerovoracaceae bacterium]
MKQSKSVIGVAKPHSIKKFELIENYVDKWARTLLHYNKSDGIVFIDCMCNAGMYKDKNGRLIEGSAIRIIKKLDEINSHYHKDVKVYFNDIDERKIEYLEKAIVGLNICNVDWKLNCQDANQFLKEFDMAGMDQKHSLLFYDPYKAAIDWTAIDPFLKRWGEVIVNHMVSDSIRGIKTARKPEAINKYMQTYECEFELLYEKGTSKQEFEKLIFNAMRKHTETFNGECFISTIPFYIKTNQLIYNLVFFTRNLKGF